VLSITILAGHNTLGIAFQNDIFVYAENMFNVLPHRARSKHGSFVHVARVTVTSSTTLTRQSEIV